MLTLNSEIAMAMEKFTEHSGTFTPSPRGDWESRRQAMKMMFSNITFPEPVTEDVVIEEFWIDVTNGNKIPLRLYRVKGTEPSAALVYTHGGGKIGLDLDTYDPVCSYYAAKAGVAVLSVGFRMAPEFPFPTSVEDCYAGLIWLSEHVDELGICPSSVGIAGDSGGGSFATGVAMMARDRKGPALAKQFLIYPMLDDRNVVPDPLLEPFAVWSYDDNWTGWNCYLGDAMGTDEVSPYAVPVRATDFKKLPPAYMDIGELDIFRDETIHFASQLAKAGVSVELHVHPGAPHGFEVLAPESDISKRVWKDRIRAIRSLYLLVP